MFPPVLPGRATPSIWIGMLYDYLGGIGPSLCCQVCAMPGGAVGLSGLDRSPGRVVSGHAPGGIQCSLTSTILLLPCILDPFNL